VTEADIITKLYTGIKLLLEKEKDAATVVMATAEAAAAAAQVQAQVQTRAVFVKEEVTAAAQAAARVRTAAEAVAKWLHVEAAGTENTEIGAARRWRRPRLWLRRWQRARRRQSAGARAKQRSGRPVSRFACFQRARTFSTTSSFFSIRLLACELNYEIPGALSTKETTNQAVATVLVAHHAAYHALRGIDCTWVL